MNPISTGNRLRRMAGSPRAHLLGLSALALLVCLRIDPRREPLLFDQAYFVYLGQAISRGEPIYATSFFGYPPLGPLLAAASMRVGAWFDLPSYLAPRFAGMSVYVLCVALAYQVVRRATGSAWAGALSGVVLASFSLFSTLSVASLEPKILVALFTLAAAAALQRGSAFGAGLASSLCFGCWQPAGLVALCAGASIAWQRRARPWPAARRFGAGVALGLLPVVLYLWASDGWYDFWQRGFVIPASVQLTAPTPSGLWLRVLRNYWSNELLFFVAAAAGFAVFVTASALRGPRVMAQAWLGPRMGGMPLLALAWAAFNASDFQGPPDLLPMLPVVSFWCGWGAQRLLAALAGTPRLAAGLAALLLVASAVYGLGDAWHHRPGMTLDEERALMGELLASAKPGEPVVGFEASEIYVFDERPNPVGFLVLNGLFVRFADLVDPKGCKGVQRRVYRQWPRVVAIQIHKWQSRCAVEIGYGLELRGYERGEVELPWERHRSYLPDASKRSRILWYVYERPDGLFVPGARRRSRPPSG